MTSSPSTATAAIQNLALALEHIALTLREYNACLESQTDASEQDRMLVALRNLEQGLAEGIDRISAFRTANRILEADKSEFRGGQRDAPPQR